MLNEIYSVAYLELLDYGIELLKPRGCASEEQRGDAAKILSQDGVEHGTQLDLHILGLSKRTIRKRYGYKYAKMDNPAYL